MLQHQRQLIELVKLAAPGPSRGAEIGVARGETSAVLLQAFPSLTLFMIDSWSTFPKDDPYRMSGDRSAALTKEQQNDNFSEAMRATEFAGARRQVVVERSAAAAANFADRFLDFVFIDADHTYAAVRADLQAWWPKVRVGGIFSGHDYGSPRDRRGIWGVSRAVNEFAQANSFQVQLGNGKVWWIVVL